MILLFQILFLFFSIFAVLGVVQKKRNGLLGVKGIIFWLLFWLLANIAVWWPNSTTILANHLGIGRGTDFVIYISLAVIFYVLFRLHIKIESLGRDLTKVVRVDSLRSPQNEK